MAKYLDYAGLQYLWAKIKNYVSTQPLGSNVRYDQQTLTSAQQSQARANIMAGGSNENLLDNWYFVGGGSQLGDGIFPINQRGQTSYGNGQTFDRWKLSAGGTVTLTQSGITFNGLLFQKKALDLVVGETYTLSRQTQNGEVVSITGVVPSTEGWMIGSDAFGVYFRPSTKVCDIQIWGDYSLRAMKLEKGTVSTLANDVPPDYGEELLKCQRYLYIPTFPWYAWTGTLAMATSATDFNWVINTPVPMRQGAVPTIGITASVYINGTAASNLSIVNAPVGNFVKISGTSAGMTSGQLYPVNTSADNVSVILSAEP